MTRIVLSPYSDVSPGTVLIGANCINEENDALAASGKAVVVDPYSCSEEIAAAYGYCWTFALELTEVLGDRLNSLFAVHYNRRYWETLLLPWTVLFLHNIYDRYRRLVWVAENIPDPEIELPRFDDSTVVYRNTMDVLEQSHLHSTNGKLYAQLLKNLSFPFKIKEFNSPMDSAQGSPERRSGLRDLTRKILEIFFKYNQKTLNSHYGEIRPDWISRISRGCQPLQEEGFFREKVDRSSIDLGGWDDEFKTFVARALPRLLPLSMLEEYGQRRRFVREYLRKTKLDKLFYTSTFWGSDTLRYLAGELKERGGKLIGQQHGGGYGHYTLQVHERVERKVSDYYITWGWSDEREGKTIPLPSPTLSEIRDSHSRENDSIIFVATHGPMYMFRYQTYWVPEVVYFKYYPMKRKFFEKLEKPLLRKIKYRPFPIDNYGWNEKQRVLGMAPDVGFDNAPRAIDSMKSCMLAVIDHPGTSMLESFAMNVPTILFWNRDFCPMRREAEPYFQLLVDGEILFYDSEKTAAKINEIQGNIESWWADGERQDAKKEFCRAFARTDSSPWQKWRDALEPVVGPLSGFLD